MSAQSSPKKVVKKSAMEEPEQRTIFEDQKNGEIELEKEGIKKGHSFKEPNFVLNCCSITDPNKQLQYIAEEKKVDDYLFNIQSSILLDYYANNIK